MVYGKPPLSIAKNTQNPFLLFKHSQVSMMRNNFQPCLNGFSLQ